MKRLNRAVILLLTLAHTCYAVRVRPLPETARAHISHGFYDLLLAGFVRHSSFADSRQVVSSQQGLYLFFPEKKIYDACGKDINARGQSNMCVLDTSLHMRVQNTACEPIIMRGVLNVDFIGPVGFVRNVRSVFANTGALRMRFAYAEIEKDWWTFTAGQLWTPMYLPCCAPDTVSYNNGSPIDPYTWIPQIRFTTRHDRFTFVAVASSQLIYPSLGPQGATPLYIRRAMMPNMHFQAQARVKEHTFCAGIDILRLAPRIVTTKGYKVHESIMSARFFALASLRFGRVHCNMKVLAMQNPSDLLATGGYAVRTVNPTTDRRTYANLRTAGAWMDIAYKAAIEPGLFVGGIKNLGADTHIIKSIERSPGIVEPTLYSYAPDIGYIARVSPRVRFFWDTIELGLELEYTRASYGTVTCEGKVANATSVGNVRFVSALTYTF